MKVIKRNNIAAFLTLATVLFAFSNASAQFENKWMSVGSLQSWYSEIGSEIEEGYVKIQQYGLQWPAIYQYQSNEASKALWIGATNFTDESGRNYPYKVVHVGPRVNGAGEFFPIKFTTVSKFTPPQVYVDDVPSFLKPVQNDVVDPTMKPDRMLIDVANTQLGLTMTRKIFQFSQQNNNNYIISAYTFTNTGNVNADPKIELPNNTLTGVYFYFQWRLAITRETGFEIGNATRWGINTMDDARGDGAVNIAKYKDPPDQRFRAQFSWQGKYPPFTNYDNIGGPIWNANVPLISKGDTVGRLGAIQFVGVVTLHADKSATDTTDDPNQPSTTNYISSDDPNLESNNSAYNPVRMEYEYKKAMSTGHETPRQANKVQPNGKFDEPTGDPSLGTTGGWTFANGYGPYTIKPGQSVHIVFAEAAAGLNRKTATSVGRKYKEGLITAKQKDDSVLTGMDSLFQTFRRAIANYDNGYDIPEPPLPPKVFNVRSGGNKISLSWSLYNADPNIDYFAIYRADGQYDSTYHLLKKVPATGKLDYSYDDTTPIRGLAYYYYVIAMGKNRLHSSRYYTQTYDLATLKRPPGKSMSDIRVVPNPFNISAAKELGFGDQQPNRLAFFNIPGRCTIKIYTEIGELIKTIVHTDGSGDAYWDSVTSSNQVVVSGIYIAVIHNDETGEQRIVKFVIIR